VTPETFLGLVVRPTLSWLGQPYAGTAREVLLLAIALQESRLRWRVQMGVDGRPLINLGRSFFQFEQSGVSGVLNHKRCAWIHERIGALGYTPTVPVIHDAMADNDTLATLMATALLWSDTRRLPELGDQHGSWLLYRRTWRPGYPREESWASCYAAAMAALDG
jgi:hypothetical protein